MAVEVGLLALSFAMSYLASRLLAPKNKSVLQDDKPTTLSTRGSYVPYVTGRQRGGVIFSSVFDDQIKKESVGGGKGPPTPEVNVYYQGGWHLICSNGPVRRLYRILQNGKAIFEGPIDAFTHPSGSEVSCGKEGSFLIYWGEPDQPINTYLGARLGVNSRWPFQFYVLWKEKRLGTQKSWPLLDYEFESRPYQTGLGQSSSWFEATRSLSGVPYPIVSTTNGTIGDATIVISGDRRAEFKNGTYLKLVGNSATNGDYLILDSSYVNFTGSPPFITPVNQTTIRLGQVLAGANNLGTVQVYLSQEDDGPNPAHLIYQMMFGQFPHGMEMDKSEWNMDSLEYIGVLCETERIPMRLFVQDGQNFKATLANLLQDIGVMIVWDNGLYRFKEIRKVDPLTIPVLTQDLVTSKLPQIETNHDERPVDRSIYVFADRKRSFRDMTIAVDDDGHASLSRVQRPRKVSLPNVIDYKTAVKISERRSQEDLAGASKYKFSANRQARLLFPGQAVLVSGIPFVVRLTSKKVDLLSGQVDLEGIQDSYGVDSSSFQNNDGGGFEPAVSNVDPDVISTIVEVPAYLSPGLMTIIVPKVRASSVVQGSDIWLSGDNNSYVQKTRDVYAQTGGLLTEAMLGTGKTLIENGPAFIPLGPDIGTAIDLSGDTINWRAGRQICIIDDEIFFLRNVSAIGGGQYRLQGLLRARFDSSLQVHVVNSGVFIFNVEAIEYIQDSLLQPNVSVWTKTQPFTTESYPLSQVVPNMRTLIGKGIVPIRPANLRTVNNSNSYRTGESLPMKWTYRSSALPGSGAGMQRAGNAVGQSPIQGEFMLRIKTTGGVVKRDIGGLTGTTFTYSNSLLVADFGSNPTSFKAEVFNTSGGYRSPGYEITIVRSN